MGEQGWRSGESTGLPLMWPRLDSQCFVASHPCSERFFFLFLRFFPPQKSIPIRSGKLSPISALCQIHWRYKKKTFIFYIYLFIFCIVLKRAPRDSCVKRRGGLRAPRSWGKWGLWAPHTWGSFKFLHRMQTWSWTVLWFSTSVWISSFRIWNQTKKELCIERNTLKNLFSHSRLKILLEMWCQLYKVVACSVD